MKSTTVSLLRKKEDIMATKTFEELKQLAIQIRDEKTNKQNTATRIGTQMLEHLNKLEQDYYDKTATDEELKQRDEKLTELSSELAKGFFQNKTLNNYISDFYINVDKYTGNKSLDNLYITRFGISAGYATLTICNQPTYSSDSIVIQYYKKDTPNGYIRTYKDGIVFEAIIDEWPSELYTLENALIFKNSYNKDISGFKSVYNISDDPVINSVIKELYIAEEDITSGYSYNDFYKIALRKGYYNGGSYFTGLVIFAEDGTVIVRMQFVSTEKDTSSLKFINNEINKFENSYIIADFSKLGTDLYESRSILLNCSSFATNPVIYSYINSCTYTNDNIVNSIVKDLYIDKSEYAGELNIDTLYINRIGVSSGFIYLTICNVVTYNSKNIICQYYEKDEGQELLEFAKNGIKCKAIIDRNKIPAELLVLSAKILEVAYDNTTFYTVWQDNLESLFIGNLFNETDLSSADKKYLDANDGTVKVSSSNHQISAYIDISDYNILYLGNIYSLCLYNSGKEFINGVINADKISINNAKYMRYDILPSDGKQYIIYPNYPINKADDLHIPKLRVEGEQVDMFIPTYFGIKQAIPNSTPKGVTYSEEAPDLSFYGDAYIAGKGGTILGVPEVEQNEILFYDNGFNRRLKNNVQYTEQKYYDVVILGAGSGGMGAAYALIDSGYRVAIIDRLSYLGGNSTNAGVSTWIQSAIPKHIQQICDDLSIDVSNSWLRSEFANTPQNGYVIPTETLANKYKQDLNGKIDTYLNAEFICVGDRYNRNINYIFVRLEDGTVCKFSARIFIDASGDGVMCRSSNNIGWYVGRDPKELYNEESAQVTVNESNRFRLNEPSLFYRMKYGLDDTGTLDKCTTVYATYEEDGSTIKDIIKPDYIYQDGYKDSEDIVNPMAGLGWDDYNISLRMDGKTLTELYKQRTIEHCKYIKLGLKKAQQQGSATFGVYNTDFLNYGYKETLDYVGIRETYRIKCDYMMRQSDLSILLTSKNVESNHYIAESSHIIDSHMRSGLVDIDVFNDTKLRPCGIKYEAIIPYKLNNVLIASRCYGASQIFASASRVNGTIAAIGQAAGYAAKIFLEDDLYDVRNVSITKLQSSNYTNFKGIVAILESKYKEGLS